MCRWDRPLSDEFEKRSVIILIPIRLGESTINPVYIPCLQNLFKVDGFIGIVGGKPRHSLYFVGVQGTVPTSNIKLKSCRFLLVHIRLLSSEM